MRNKNLKEILVKLKNVYPVDMWIYKPKGTVYTCKEGKSSFNKLYGHYISLLEPKWMEVIDEVIPESLIYIPNVDDFKKWSDNEEDPRPITDLYEVHDDPRSLNEMETNILISLGKSDEVNDWKSFVDDPEFIKEVFVDKGIYSLLLQNGEMIRLGKPSLPLVTEKTADKLYYNASYDETLKLWSLILKFNFTHFLLYMYYKAVPMKK